MSVRNNCYGNRLEGGPGEAKSLYGNRSINNRSLIIPGCCYSPQASFRDSISARRDLECERDEARVVEREQEARDVRARTARLILKRKREQGAARRGESRRNETKARGRRRSARAKIRAPPFLLHLLPLPPLVLVFPTLSHPPSLPSHPRFFVGEGFLRFHRVISPYGCNASCFRSLVLFLFSPSCSRLFPRDFSRDAICNAAGIRREG